MRLDFPSFYGTEYYCPVSQLKVYGLNQMEAFKMEQRRSAEATRDEAAEAAERAHQAAQQEQERVDAERRAAEAREREEESKREQELCELEKLVQAQARRGRELEYEEIIQCAPSAASTVSASVSAPAAGAPPAGDASVSAGGPNASVSGSGSASAAVPAGTGAPASENGSAVSSVAPLPSAQKRDASESIYAHIVRRLSALEGNGTLVARYIDEQARALRGAVSRLESVQQTLLAALSDAERAHAGADARLLRLSTQVEYLRLTGERDRHAAQAQLRALADELGFERRKSVAQLVILIGIVALALFSKSATVETLLRPLAERPTRHGKKLSSGPLAGLVIDVATPRPFPGRDEWAGEDGPQSPQSPHGPHGLLSPLSPSQPRRRKGSRPTTPTLAHLKRRALAQRSLSIHGETEDAVPPPRSKLRSAHLHPLRRPDDDLPPYPYPYPHAHSHSQPASARSPARSPGFPPGAARLGAPSPRSLMTPTPRRRRFPHGDESQWDTSVNGTSTSASASASNSEPASDPNELGSASEASNDLVSEEEEYNGIGGLHPHPPTGGSFST